MVRASESQRSLRDIMIDYSYVECSMASITGLAEYIKHFPMIAGRTRSCRPSDADGSSSNRFNAPMEASTGVGRAAFPTACGSAWKDWSSPASQRHLVRFDPVAIFFFAIRTRTEDGARTLRRATTNRSRRRECGDTATRRDPELCRPHGRFWAS